MFFSLHVVNLSKQIYLFPALPCWFSIFFCQTTISFFNSVSQRRGRIESSLRPSPYGHSANSLKTWKTEVATHFTETRLWGVCNPWEMIFELLLQIKCNSCQQYFLLCRNCYRGQCYCCDRCRFIAQREARRRAQQRYRQTEKGRKAHSEAANDVGDYLPWIVVIFASIMHFSRSKMIILRKIRRINRVRYHFVRVCIVEFSWLPKEGV